MNFEPPDSSQDTPISYRTYGQSQPKLHSKFQSPLLKPPTSSLNCNQNISNNNHHSFPANKQNGTIHNRLGTKSTYDSSRQVNINLPKNGNQDKRNFIRKRVSDGTGSPMPPKRKWNPKRQKFHQNPKNNQAGYYRNNSTKVQNSANSVQNRINNIRNNTQMTPSNSIEHLNKSIPPIANENDLYNSQHNTDSVQEDGDFDLQDVDATDITVQVINNNPQNQEENFPSRFKMVLDPKVQASIKVIQQKRRDKQVIFPFPVTPNVTEISLHERFTLL